MQICPSHFDMSFIPVNLWQKGPIQDSNFRLWKIDFSVHPKISGHQRSALILFIWNYDYLFKCCWDKTFLTGIRKIVETIFKIDFMEWRWRVHNSMTLFYLSIPDGSFCHYENGSLFIYSGNIFMSRSLVHTF